MIKNHNTDLRLKYLNEELQKHPKGRSDMSYTGIDRYGKSITCNMPITKEDEEVFDEVEKTVIKKYYS